MAFSGCWNESLLTLAVEKWLLRSEVDSEGWQETMWGKNNLLKVDETKAEGRK